MFHPNQEKLINNLHLISTDVPHVHLSALYAYVKVGAIHEETGERGYAHLLEHLLLKRLTTQRYDVLTKFCASRGMYFNAATSMEFTNFYILDILPEHTKEALTFLHQILFHPVFTAQELEEEKEIVISELKEHQSSPHYKMQRAFSSYFFGEHTLGREVGGLETDVRTATFEQ